MNVETEIVNRALDIIGHARIVDINDTNDPVAVRCKLDFSSELYATLRDHWWNCAKDRAYITEDTTAPVFGWAHRYLIPYDAIKIRLDDDYCNAEWEREGRYILTDLTSPLAVIITKRITNMAELDADFTAAFEYRLAARYALSFQNDTGKAQGMTSQYLGMIEQAKTNDAQEGSARSWRGTGRYRTVRGY
jgi:hypothetical protein